MQKNCSANLTREQAQSRQLNPVLVASAEIVVRDIQREIAACASLMGDVKNIIHCRLRGGCPWRCFEKEPLAKLNRVMQLRESGVAHE